MDFTPGKKRPGRTPRGDGRSAFRAHAAAIHQQLEDGRTRRAVWLEYRERLGWLSYVQFTRYVKSDKRATAAATPAPRSARPAAPSAPRQASIREAPGDSHGQRQFQYDPMVDKDELI